MGATGTDSKRDFGGSSVIRRVPDHGGEVSDEALLAGMAQGDERAAMVFVRRYQRRVFGLAYSMVSNSALAEDLAQEALYRAWRHAPVYDPRRGSVTTWVLTIARNLAIDALRIRQSVPLEPDKLVAIIESGPSSANAFGQSDTAASVRGALATLPIEQRRALMLAGIYGYSAQEVSNAEAIPLGTAKSRIRAGLAKMRTILAVDEDENR